MGGDLVSASEYWAKEIARDDKGMTAWEFFREEREAYYGADSERFPEGISSYPTEVWPG